MIMLFLTGAFVLLVGTISGVAIAMAAMKILSQGEYVPMDDYEYEPEEEEEL